MYQHASYYYHDLVNGGGYNEALLNILYNYPFFSADAITDLNPIHPNDIIKHITDPTLLPIHIPKNPPIRNTILNAIAVFFMFWLFNWLYLV